MKQLFILLLIALVVTTGVIATPTPNELTECDEDSMIQTGYGLEEIKTDKLNDNKYLVTEDKNEI